VNNVTRLTSSHPRPILSAFLCFLQFRGNILISSSLGPQCFVRLPSVGTEVGRSVLCLPPTRVYCAKIKMSLYQQKNFCGWLFLLLARCRPGQFYVFHPALGEQRSVFCLFPFQGIFLTFLGFFDLFFPLTPLFLRWAFSHFLDGGPCGPLVYPHVPSVGRFKETYLISLVVVIGPPTFSAPNELPSQMA